jgi:hypothetical protein
MKKLLIIIIALSIWSCQSSNDSFDPFDKDFSFHNTMNTAEYDTIWDSCGYWDFEKSNHGLKTAYIFYFDDIIGKGFSLEIDSIETNDCDSLFYDRDDKNTIEDLFTQYPIKVTEVKARLSNLNVSEVKILSSFEVEITNSENKIFKASIRVDCNWNGKIFRHLDFTNAIDDSQRKDVTPMEL